MKRHRRPGREAARLKWDLDRAHPNASCARITRSLPDCKNSPLADILDYQRFVSHLLHKMEQYPGMFDHLIPMAGKALETANRILLTELQSQFENN